MGDGVAAVIDTGPEPEPVGRCLDQLGIDVVPLLVLTHYHADHVGGLAGVLRGRDVGLVLISPLPSPPTEASTVRSLVGTEPTARLQTARVGESLDLPGLHWQTLGPAGSFAGPTNGAPSPPAAIEDAESSAQNDGSIVGVATITRSGADRPVRVLFTGDVEPDGQQAIMADLAARGIDPTAALAVDVLKVSHHGSSRQDQGFLAATGAAVAITSSGVGNSYGHPAPSTVRRLEQLGMTVLRTDQHGGLAIRLRDGELSATGQR